MNWLVPGLQLLRGIFMLVQLKATTYAQFMTLRFLIGLFNAALYPGVHYVLRSWYRRVEINMRGGLYYAGYVAGSFSASLI
jgi:MFS family permease